MSIHLFTDILFYNGKFYTEKSNIKKCSIRRNEEFYWQPEDINNIVNVIKSEDVIVDTKINVLTESFHSNMGHLLWDFMYPSWYSLYTLLREQCNENFQWITIKNIDDRFGGWHEEIIEQFSGNKITSLQVLSSFDRPILYKKLIVGVETVGLLTVGEDFLCKTRLHNDISDPIDAYVNRMYKRYNIERRILSKGDKPSILYVEITSRRYSNNDEAFAKIKENNKNCDVKKVAWEDYEKDFKGQLEILNNTNIIVVGTGTGRSRTPFLPNGSVEIQTLYYNENNKYTNLMYYDFYFSSLTNNVKVFNIPFYTDYEIKNKICSGLINHYIKQAIDIVPVKTPVNRKDNLPNLIKNIQQNINSSKSNREIFNKWRKNFRLEQDLYNLVSVENICIIPICGYASRIGNVPKFMLPIENGNSLIKNTVTQCKNSFFKCSIITTPDHGTMIYNYLTRHSLLENVNITITETKTMSETVLKGKNDKNVTYSLLMPDTYFEDKEVLKKMNNTYQLYECDVVVGIFKIRKEQVGKLGQVLFDDDNNLQDVVDKDEHCKHEWAWGSILWNYKFFNFIDKKESHIGYALPKIIQDPNMKVKVCKLDGNYYDCGTIKEYSDLLNITN